MTAWEEGQCYGDCDRIATPVWRVIYEMKPDKTTAVQVLYMEQLLCDRCLDEALLREGAAGHTIKVEEIRS